MKLSKKLVLVDGSSYLFRAFHALPPLTNSHGTPTGAIYGVVTMLRKLLQEEAPDYIAVIFDTKTKNFRHTLYPDYKANRTEMPSDLAIQIEPLHQIIRALGLPLLAVEGVEADDVIGTLADLASKAHSEVLISTGDKDLAQLVNPQITLVNTMTGVRLDEQGVRDKFGVSPTQMIDYLTLVGDPVDHIQGVPKVGPKTAAKWLAEYGDLGTLIQHVDEIKGKVGEHLRTALSQLPLTRQLVTVQRDISHLPVFSDLILQPRQEVILQSLFKQLEFKSWLKEEISLPAAKADYENIFSEARLLAWVREIEEKGMVAIDTESTSLDPLKATLVGISLCIEAGKAAYIPLKHDYPDCPAQLPLEWVLSQIKPILGSSAIVKIGQNCKYDMHIFGALNIPFQGTLEDTMLQSYVLNSVSMRHDMDTLAKHYLHHDTIHYETVAGKGAKQITFDKVDIQAATAYAAEDAEVTWRLHMTLSEKLAKTPTLLSLYREIEVPLIPVLQQMEAHGVCIEVNALKVQSEQIEDRLKTLEEQAFILAGEAFNLGSPKQLQHIFYEKLKLPILEKTPKGAPSTAESVLQALSEEYELPKIIWEHRTLSKLKSTYLDKLPLQVNAHTQRVHTSYHQAVTATGRLSSSDPNLQNIPIRTPEGRKIRQAFVSPPGYVLMAADYSQIELRIMAHLSQDERLMAAFQQGQDIHRYTASEILSVPLEAVTPEDRRRAKAVNFGLIYGMSAFGLARTLQIPREEAQVYMDRYFARYPGVKNYMEATRTKATEQGFVETLWGRRLYLPDIRAKQLSRRRAAERAAINAPMQGTAADIIKKAMIHIHQALHAQEDIKMIMQVHDELVFEVRLESVEKAKALVVPLMQHFDLSLPLEVNVGVGHNWDEAH